ncbi:MAG: prolipoprotein diacylglyceryl transferase [Ruminococcaceae bacterium]|nr:prolipoprotein diacylglyceryl transferase [Oscillospiraceae bacterium]
MTRITFPGLGIGPIVVDPIAFTVFGVSVTWYGLLITCGMVLAFFYCLHRAKQEGIKSDDVIDLAIVTVILSILGARLYYVVFAFEEFIATGGTPLQNFWNTFLAVINIRNGGLAIYGGIIGGFFAGLIISKVKKIRFPILLDVLVGGVMIGQIIGRWGNFINGEAYGYECKLPWRMGIEKCAIGTSFWSEMIEVHPTFFYESLWNLIGFVILCIFYKKKKFNGQVFAFYMLWYGAGRAVIEGFRSDSLWLFGEGTVRVSQALGIGTAIVGIIILVLGFIKIYKGIDIWADLMSEFKPKKKH